MELVAFVKQDQIDPIYFDASYFMMPDKDAEKPYALLLKTLEDSDRVGIATVTMHQREYTVFIRPRKNGLTVHTIVLPERNSRSRRLRPSRKRRKAEARRNQTRRATRRKVLAADAFVRRNSYDKFQENLKALIEAKQKGREVIAEEQPKPARVIDMMEALKRSLAQSSSQKHAADGSREKKPARRTTIDPHRRKAS